MSHDVSSEVYPDFEANDVTYAYDYWRDTPAFDALEAISGGNIETGLAVVSILITIVVAYRASRKDAPRYAFLFGYAFVSAYISGAISYILLVQMSSFDLAHWFASFATPVVAIHLLFFASLFSLALQAFWLASFEMQHQAEKATREGAGWRATRLIVFLSISMLMTIIGFFDCRDVLFSFVCKNVSGLGEWRVAAATISKLFGIFALSGLIAQGYCTVRNQKPKRRQKQRRGAVVSSALTIALVFLIGSEMCLRFLGANLVDSEEGMRTVAEAVTAENYTSREVQLNIMLKTKKEVYFDKNGDVYETLAYGYN